LRGAQRRSEVEERVGSRYLRFVLGLSGGGFRLFDACLFGRAFALYLLELPK